MRRFYESSDVQFATVSLCLRSKSNKPPTLLVCFKNILGLRPRATGDKIDASVAGSSQFRPDDDHPDRPSDATRIPRGP